MKYDALVIGAGMVGVSAALHLQQRGRSVALVDRRGAAEETSHGNGGIIQREGVVPYGFPRDIAKLFDYALNRLPEAHVHWSALPSIAPWLIRYFLASSPEALARSARAMRPLVERCIVEHEALMAEAGATGMIRNTGYLRVFRTARRFDEQAAVEERNRSLYGINSATRTAAEIKQLEPHLTADLAGGCHYLDPVSVADPSALGKAYADLFRRRGGHFLTADARTLEAAADGWQVRTVDGPVSARDAVVALGPWAAEVLRPLGFTPPLGWKRGYHMHFGARGNAALARPVIDVEYGYLLMQAANGIRLTTGAEFARRDAPPTPVQLTKVEPLARELFPLADRLDPKPWLGARPCFPDMVPMIGAIPGHKGLWADFGHHHLGFTLGPVSGRLIAEMVTGEPTHTDPWPYRADRFS
ncbi:MAG: NAD(P)/FAD-dependent oxidoreductase [Hyphomicrobiaceae bacterium]